MGHSALAANEPLAICSLEGLLAVAPLETPQWSAPAPRCEPGGEGDQPTPVAMSMRTLMCTSN